MYKILKYPSQNIKIQTIIHAKKVEDLVAVILFGHKKEHFTFCDSMNGTEEHYAK